jgi:predicted RNase H-like HicB family nuclease
VDVSSFGETKDEAISSLKEALELYLEGGAGDYRSVEEATLVEEVVYA